MVERQMVMIEMEEEKLRKTQERASERVCHWSVKRVRAEKGKIQKEQPTRKRIENKKTAQTIIPKSARQKKGARPDPTLPWVSMGGSVGLYTAGEGIGSEDKKNAKPPLKLEEGKGKAQV